MRLERERIFRIMGLGMSGFTMAITNSSVQLIMYNTCCRGPEVIFMWDFRPSSILVREVISMPAQGGPTALSRSWGIIMG